MHRNVRTGLLLGLVLVVAVGLVLARGASASRQGWHLDIEKAMDAVGVVPGMVIGEAGAGRGYFTLPMARRVGPTGAVLANDIDGPALAALADSARREGLANVQTVEGSVDDPLFPRRDLELVVVVHAFHDLSRPVEWMTNLRKYLRPGGSLAIIDLDRSKGAPSHFLTRDRILSLAATAGYGVTRVVDDIPEYVIVVLHPGRE